MSNNVAEMLAELRADHKNMTVLLNLLEQEANRLYDGREADYELVHDIMSYMSVYPDAVHHPKEDRVYAELKIVRPDLSKGLDRVLVDHRELAALGMKLRNDIESVMSGTALRRNVIVADAMRYVQRLRDHMHWEEHDLFIRIDEMVNDGHKLLVDSVADYIEDPVFSQEVEEQFGKLFASIQQTLNASHM